MPIPILQRNQFHKLLHGAFVVPVTAKKGLDSNENCLWFKLAALSDINPCGTYTAGETHDYAIKILNFGKPTVTGRLIVCEHDSVVMNVTSVADTPVVFTWTGPGGFTGVGPKITFVDADPSLNRYLLRNSNFWRSYFFTSSC